MPGQWWSPALPHSCLRRAGARGPTYSPWAGRLPPHYPAVWNWAWSVGRTGFPGRCLQRECAVCRAQAPLLPPEAQGPAWGWHGPTLFPQGKPSTPAWAWHWGVSAGRNGIMSPPVLPFHPTGSRGAGGSPSSGCHFQSRTCSAERPGAGPGLPLSTASSWGMKPCRQHQGPESGETCVPCSGLHPSSGWTRAWSQDSWVLGQELGSHRQHSGRARQQDPGVSPSRA